MRKKEQSNSTDASDRGFKLPKSRILRGRKNFEALFSDSLLISSSSVNFRYHVISMPEEDYKVGFIAPKKIGNAVKRNRTKRIMREAFRLNRHLISNLFSPSDQTLHGAFIARTSNIEFEDVNDNVVTILTKLRNHFESDQIEIN